MKSKPNLLSSPYHLPYNPDLVERAREMRKNLTPAERRLWYGYLRHFKHRVLRQRPIDNYIVDFYCPKLKLVIEIDGSSHDSDLAKDYDSSRTAILEGYGLKVLRITNKEVLNNFSLTCSLIESALKDACE
jgi:very-short-patch-repair endonuclease